MSPYSIEARTESQESQGLFGWRKTKATRTVPLGTLVEGQTVELVHPTGLTMGVATLKKDGELEVKPEGNVSVGLGNISDFCGAVTFTGPDGINKTTWVSAVLTHGDITVRARGSEKGKQIVLTRIPEENKQEGK